MLSVVPRSRPVAAALSLFLETHPSVSENCDLAEGDPIEIEKSAKSSAVRVSVPSLARL